MVLQDGGGVRSPKATYKWSEKTLGTRETTWTLKKGWIWIARGEQRHPPRGVHGRGGQADESPGSPWGLQLAEGPIACREEPKP